MTAPVFHALPRLSIYLHIPWCEKKCPYCDFNSHAIKDGLPEEQYVDALIQDLEQELPKIQNRKVNSIFIGGGTPSLLDARSINRLLTEIHARLDCIVEPEITLEANPGSADSGKFKDFLDAGINRLSIGVQSFNNDLLQALGRVHDGKAARAAATAAVDAGFVNFNLDLMYALPGQDLEMAVSDLQTALSFKPSHLSCYQLTIEPNTVFYTYPPQLPDEDISWQIQTSFETILAQEGYGQYEISAYARDGYACRHNLNYWRFGDYLGIGAGAHSKLTVHDKVMRSWKVKHPTDYMSKANSAARIGGCKFSSAEEIRFEFMLNTMRLNEPATVKEFQQSTGQSINTVKAELQRAHKDQLLDFDGARFMTTELGRRFLNDLLQRFLPEPKPGIGDNAVAAQIELP